MRKGASLLQETVTRSKHPMVTPKEKRCTEKTRLDVMQQITRMRPRKSRSKTNSIPVSTIGLILRRVDLMGRPIVMPTWGAEYSA